MEGRHELESVTFGVPLRLLARGLEILATLDEVCAKRPHRAVLLDRIAARHVDRDRQAVAARGIGKALPVIAAGCGNNAGRGRPFALQAVDKDEPAADLE